LPKKLKLVKTNVSIALINAWD